MPSTRTQIYLTDDQRRRLDARGRRTGAPMARMIREAVDAYLTDDRPDVQAAIADGKARLDGTGRVLIRKSGTEPVVRVMAEGEDENLVRQVVEDLRGESFPVGEAHAANLSLIR